MRKAFTGVFLTIFLLFAGVFTIYCIPSARETVFVKLLGGKEVVEDSDDDLYIALTGDYPADIVVPDTVEKVRNGALYGVTINSLDLNNKPVDTSFAQCCTISSVADEYTANTVSTNASLCYFPNKIVTSGITGCRNNAYKHLVVNNVTSFSGTGMWANILELNLSSEIETFNLSTLNYLQGNRLLKITIPAGLEQCPIPSDQILKYFNSRYCVSIVCVSDEYYDEFLNLVPEDSKDYVIPLSKYAGEQVDTELVYDIVLQTQTVYKIDTKNNVLIIKSNFNGTNPTDKSHELADYYISHSNNGREYFFYMYWTTDLYGRPQLVHGAVYSRLIAQTLDSDISYSRYVNINGERTCFNFVATTDGDAYVITEDSVKEYQCLVDINQQYVAIVNTTDDDFDLYGVFQISQAEQVEFLYVNGDVCNFDGEIIALPYINQSHAFLFDSTGFYDLDSNRVFELVTKNYFVVRKMNGSIIDDILVYYPHVECHLPELMFFTPAIDDRYSGKDFVFVSDYGFELYTFSKSNNSVVVTDNNGYTGIYQYAVSDPDNTMLMYNLVDKKYEFLSTTLLDDIVRCTVFKDFDGTFIDEDNTAAHLLYSTSSHADWLITSTEIFRYSIEDIDDIHWITMGTAKCVITTLDARLLIVTDDNYIRTVFSAEGGDISKIEYRDKMVSGDGTYVSYFADNSAFHAVDIPTVYLKSMYTDSDVQPKYKLTNDTVYICDPDSGEYVVYDENICHYKLYLEDATGIMVLEMLDTNYCVREIDAGWSWTYDTTTDTDPDYTNLTLEDLETGYFSVVYATDIEYPAPTSATNSVFSTNDEPVFKIEGLAYIYYNGGYVIQNPSQIVRLYKHRATGWYVLYVSDNFAIDDTVEVENGPPQSVRRTDPVILQAKDMTSLSE